MIMVSLEVSWTEIFPIPIPIQSTPTFLLRKSKKVNEENHNIVLSQVKQLLGFRNRETNEEEEEGKLIFISFNCNYREHWDLWDWDSQIMIMTSFRDSAQHNPESKPSALSLIVIVTLLLV
jgi:hypothetical protein